MYRFFGKLKDDLLELDESDSHHYLKVLRIFPEEEVEVVTDSGIYRAVFERAEDKKVLLKICESLTTSNESDVKLSLVQSVLKNDKMEMAIKGAVEVGVSEIIPLIAKRNVSDVEKKEDKKLKRWQSICEVAAKQSKRDIIPKVKPLIKIDDLKNFDGEIIVCYESEKKLRVLDLDIKSKKIALVIGPEGGFEDFEIEQLKNMGAKIVSLGNRILRAETAAITASYHLIACLEGKI